MYIGVVEAYAYWSMLYTATISAGPSSDLSFIVAGRSTEFCFNVIFMWQ